MTSLKPWKSLCWNLDNSPQSLLWSTALAFNLQSAIKNSTFFTLVTDLICVSPVFHNLPLLLCITWSTHPPTLTCPSSTQPQPERTFPDYLLWFFCIYALLQCQPVKLWTPICISETSFSVWAIFESLCTDTDPVSALLYLILASCLSVFLTHFPERPESSCLVTTCSIRGSFCQKVSRYVDDHVILPYCSLSPALDCTRIEKSFCMWL